MAFAAAPAATVDPSLAFSTPDLAGPDGPAAAAYCRANSLGEVVRRDSITTSKLYGKPNYFTYYLKRAEAGFAPNDPTGSGAYYCAAFAISKGWKESPQPRP